MVAAPGTVHDWLADNPPAPDRFTQTLAGVARRTSAGEDGLAALREFLDEYRVRWSAELRADAIAAEPPPSGDRRIDALLAAVGEHLAALEGGSAPAWVQEPDRFLERFWFPSEVPGFRAIAIAQSPAAFRRRGIMIAAGFLERV